MSEGKCCCLTGFLCFVGAIVVGKLLLQLAGWIYKIFFFKSKKIKKYVGKGKWAIITGCCSGIGEGFSHELASLGCNLILIDFSRTLPEFARMIQEKYKVETVHQHMDLSKVDNSEAYGKLRDATKGLRITVLINNVGINTSMPKYFTEHTDRELEMFYNVNMRSHFEMTRKIALPSMQENKSGLIINLASHMGSCPAAMYSVYSATKAFIEIWTKVLRFELALKGIEVYAVAPMFVKSNMSGFRKLKTTFFMAVISGRHMARISLNRAGCWLNDHIISPHWHHNIWTYIYRSILPNWIYQRVMLKRNIGLQKYYKRKARERMERKKD